MRHVLPKLTVGVTALALAACAGGIPLRQSEQQVRDRYHAYAGEPIDHFTWLGRHDEGWEPIDRYELVLFANISDAYLLKVGPPCENLEFARHIGVTQTNDAVYTRFDYVTTGQWRCPIQEIRRIDYRRMRADLRQEAQKSKADAAPAQR